MSPPCYPGIEFPFVKNSIKGLKKWGISILKGWHKIFAPEQLTEETNVFKLNPQSKSNFKRKSESQNGKQRLHILHCFFRRGDVLVL